MGSSAFTNCADTKILAVICDLDGTLLNTGPVVFHLQISLLKICDLFSFLFMGFLNSDFLFLGWSAEIATRGILKEFLGRYDKVLRTDNEHGRLGRTQKESAIVIVRDYDLPLTPDQFIEEITPLYRSKWAEAKALPGAYRLIAHLHKHQVPLALASNSLREYIDAKISHHKGWKECFSAILGSDQVKSGKPAPDLYIEAATRMEVDAADCLVIEDSLIGVKAAKAAGMKVVAVPSLSEADAASQADTVLHSLLDFQPESWGLPPFDDWVDNALPIDPIYLEGLFSDGFLAEFPGKSEQENELNVLPDQVSGVYFGWAKVNKVDALKAVVGIGSEHCSASHRNIQLCVVNGSNDHLSDQQLLQVWLVGYIRGFNWGATNLNGEINEEDRMIASIALDHQPAFISHEYLSPGVEAPLREASAA
ncbi:hypothetical protein Dimus_019875 [Dionaea muscipula]